MTTFRKPIRKVSKSRARQNREYTKLKAAFLEANPLCQACSDFGTVPARSTEVHHVRGRSGKLLCDTRYWLAIDPRCHCMIHQHPAIAKKLGLLANMGEWGRQDPPPAKEAA